MVTPLEKARLAPDSMKAKILKIARKVFGEYGFHGTTTRMIAEKVGIDISTLYYHWGEKSDLYEGVIIDINDDLHNKLGETEKMIVGLPLEERMVIAIDTMTDYLFNHPEISNLILFQYFTKTRSKAQFDVEIPRFISDIALSMGLIKDKKDPTIQPRLQVLAIMNAIHNFISGEVFFRSILDVEKNAFVQEVKKTLKLILIPAFTKPVK